MKVILLIALGLITESSIIKKPELRVAVVETGNRSYSIARRYGTVADDMKRMLSPAFTVTKIHSYLYQMDHKKVDDYDLIVIPGTMHSVEERLPWMHEMTCMIQNTNRKAWILGICFGHHLVAAAFDGVVEWNPGRQWDSGVVDISIDTKLVPSRVDKITTLTCHMQHVSKLPTRGFFKQWATDHEGSVQGMLSEYYRIITTQFHPDLSKEYYCGTAARRGANDTVVVQVERAKVDTEEMAHILAVLIG